jgi:hypothetical protein
MRHSGRHALKILSVFIFISTPLIAQEQIVFFSQSDQPVKEQESHFINRSGSTRELIFLNGIYELLNMETREVMGAISLPSVSHHRRSFIFRKGFPKQKNQKAHYFLYAERLVGKSKIYINNQMVFEGDQNFLPLQIRIPAELLTKNQNSLEIHLTPWSGRDDQFPRWFPINLPRIDNGSSGIIFLGVMPEMMISNVQLRPSLRESKGIIEGEITIVSSVPNLDDLQIGMQVFSQGEIVKSVSLQLVADSLAYIHQLPIKLELDSAKTWSPDDPSYYQVSVNLKHDDQLMDQYQSRIGFRNLHFQNNKLYLNDKQFAWKGINYVYQDLEGVGLFDRNLILSDLLEIKTSGFNLLRIAYYPQSKRFYHLTDSLGLMCLQDLPVPLLLNGLIKDSLQTQKLLGYVGNFQRIAHEHPSVIGIGVGYFYVENLVRNQNRFESLMKKISSDRHWLSYVGHFDRTALEQSSAELGILEILERNEPDVYLDKLENRQTFNLPLILSGLSRSFSYPPDSSQSLTHLTSLENFRWSLMQKVVQDKIAGQILFTYSDYFLETPSLQSGSKFQSTFQLFSSGLWSLNRQIKPEGELILKERWVHTEDISQSSSGREIHTYLFIIIGIINFFIFLFIYRSFMEFRKNVFRSIRRPHGFFVELFERRMISFEQSFYLMLVISVNAAVMLGGILYFFRNNLLLDYFISLFLTQPEAKYYTIYVIWKPYLLIPALTFLVMLIFLLLTLGIQFLTFFRKPRIRLRQAVATSTWAASPFLFLLPFGMFFYNLLLGLNSYWILGIVLLYFHAWYIIRWLNGTRVMAVLSYTRVFMYALFLAILFGVGVFLLFQRELNLTAHLKILIQLFMSHV